MLLQAIFLVAAIPQAQVSLDLPSGLPQSVFIELKLNGKQTALQLSKRSLRSPEFQLWNSDGEIKQIPESKTYFGTLRNMPGWNVAASLEESGLKATLLSPTGDKWKITPVGDHRVRHQIKKDIAPPIDMCGVDDVHPFPTEKGNNQHGRAWGITPPANGNPIPSPFPWSWELQKSRIAFDATYDYWQREGQTVAGVTAGVEYQLAENDICYARDSLITYELTGIVIRQTPYYANNGNGSGVMLSDFASDWDNNQGHIPYESAVLLADYQNDGIAGLAYVGTLGEGGWGYAGLFWDRGHSPGIIAHEVGHNWGAGHIDCWPWGGSAMCGAWLLLGPDTTNIIKDRANYLGLPAMPRYLNAVRPYADPDWVSCDSQSELYIDVLENDYDANFEFLHISGVDAISEKGGSAVVMPGIGPGGRDQIKYTPHRTSIGSYTDTFWYAAADSTGLEHWTPVTIDVKEDNLVVEWKFEEGSGNQILDNSGNHNDATASGPVIFTELDDPQTVFECSSNPWSPSRNLWDNDSNTNFSSADQGSVSVSFTRDVADGTWLEFDFASPIKIDGFKHQDLANSNEWIKTSSLWFSNDNVFDVNDTEVVIQHHNHGEFVEYETGGITAQFVRWEVTEQYDANSNVHSLGGKEIAFLVDAEMAAVLSPSLLLSSNAQTGKGASNLVDDNQSTEFVSPGQGVVSAPLTRNTNDGTWAEFDFQAPRSFKGASFLDLPTITTWTGESRLWFSNSPSFSLTDPVITWEHGNQEFQQAITFAPIQARYLRWEISKKTPLTWFNDMGGRELTMFTDYANSPGFLREPGPYGDCINIVQRINLENSNAQSMPAAANSPFTINVFVKPEGGQSDGTLIGGFGSPGDTGRFFEVKNNRLFFNGIDSSWVLPSSAWTMLTACFDGTNMSLYQNGSLLGQWPTSFSSTSNALSLAPANPNYVDAYYRGLVDEFAVWDFSFNEIEVAELLTGGAAHGPTPFDTQTMVNNSPRLSWVPARNTPQHDVYLASTFEAARDAQIGSADHLGRFTSAHVDLQNLTPKTWYFWRVDEVHNNGDIIPGKVWRFRTELPWTTTMLEGFGDGNDGDHLNGLGGGLGFSSSWSVPTGNGYKHRSGSISAYPTNLPFAETDGYFERKTVANMAMEGERTLDSSAVDIDLAGDGSFYISFAVRLNGADSEMTAMCGLKNSFNGDTILGGCEGGRWAVSGTTGNAEGVGATKSRTQFIVLRIDASGQHNDLLWMKIYDSASDLVHADDSQLSGVGNGQNQWDLVSPGASSNGNYDQLFIRAGGNKTFSTSYVEIDEIRIGRSWSDITGL